MGVIRRHLRAWTAIWALGQCAVLVAFIPRDCCAAHRSHADDTASHQHDDMAPGARCPMRGRDGRPCPMHRAPARHPHHGAHTEAPAGEAPANDPCAIRGTCNGPLAALAALLSNQAVTPDVVTVVPDQRDTVRRPFPVPPVLGTSPAPDTPPPRA